jgi:hypothetical protein
MEQISGALSSQVAIFSSCYCRARFLLGNVDNSADQTADKEGNQRNYHVDFIKARAKVGEID